MVIVLPTLEGTSITLRPGHLIKGDYFERFVSNIFRQLSEDEIKELDPKLIQYTQKSK